MVEQSNATSYIAVMAMEVYTSEKPAVPHRALMGSILLLGAACALAASITNQRERDTLGASVNPKGWSITFQPPRLFMHLQAEFTELGPTYVYTGATRSGAEVYLFGIRFTPRANRRADDLCRELLRSPLMNDGSQPEAEIPTATDAKLGSLGAAQIADPQRGVIVRAAYLSDTEAYAFGLMILPPKWDERTVKLFEEVCESVQVVAP